MIIFDVVTVTGHVAAKGCFIHIYTISSFQPLTLHQVMSVEWLGVYAGGTGCSGSRWVTYLRRE